MAADTPGQHGGQKEGKTIIISHVYRISVVICPAFMNNVGITLLPIDF